jgi:hypothetical protein
MKTIVLVACAALVGLAAAAHAAGRAENRFGSIHIDGRKAGQIHYTIEYGEAGDVETLKTRASLSILGVKLFNFEQTLQEEWRRGELRTLRGRTDDDGKIYEASLERGSAVYKGTLNGKPVELPDHAFPASVWHYDRGPDAALRSCDVQTDEREDRALERNAGAPGKKIPAERFDISGDWRHRLVRREAQARPVPVRRRRPRGDRAAGRLTAGTP